MRIRSLTIGMALLVSGTIVGATTQHFASAGVSSGDRPVLISITPCRIADTRAAPNTVGPRSAPLSAADTMTVDAQEPGTDCTGKIPADASALSLNITALGATQQSFLTIWPGGDRPLAASLNPAPGEPPVPNAVTTELSVDQEFEIYNDAGSVNVVIDVNGYYVDHDHDDRYHPRSEADGQFAAAADTYTKSEVDNGFVPVPETVDLSGAAFAPTDAGWDLGRYSIGRVFAETSYTCAVADVDIPAGATISRIEIAYQNYGVTASLDVNVYDTEPVAGRPVGGTLIADATVSAPSYSADLTVSLAAVDVDNALPATDAGAQLVWMCTADRQMFIHAMHITLA